MNASIVLLVAMLGQGDPPRIVQPDPPRVVVPLPMAPPTLMQRVFQSSYYTLPQTCTGPNCPQQSKPSTSGWYLGKFFGR